MWLSQNTGGPTVPEGSVVDSGIGGVAQRSGVAEVMYVGVGSVVIVPSLPG